MDFKLPIYHIGVTQDANSTIKIAVLQKTCKGWIVSHCEQILTGETSPLPKKYLTSSVTFSLKGSDCLIRSSTSHLKNKNNILKVALSELATSSAFSSNSLIISPKIGKRIQDETPITLWMTPKPTVEQYLSRLQEVGIFPDVLSCQSASLFSLAQQTPLKALPSYCLVYAGQEEITCLLVKHNAVLFSRSFPLDSAKKNYEEIRVTLNHLKDFFPLTEISVLHGMNLSDALIKSLQKLPIPLVHCPCPLNTDAKQWAMYGEAILAAYHGVSKEVVRFPYDLQFHSSQAQKHWFKRLAYLVGKCALVTTLVVNVFSSFKLRSLSNKIRENIFLTCPEMTKLPQSIKELEATLQHALEEKTESIAYPYLPNIFSPKETMELLQLFAKSSPSIKLLSFSYSLTSFPSKQHPTRPYRAKITVQGEGKPEEINILIKKLSLDSRCSDITPKVSQSSFELQFTLSQGATL